MDSYCTVAECEEATREGRIRCEFHEKRHQRGQSLTAPKAKRLDPKERLLEAALRFADADAEDDEKYERAALALLRAARNVGPTVAGDVIRQGMAAARARGVHVGRPPEVVPEDARTLLARLGSVPLVALALGKSPAAVRRALARESEGTISSHPPREAARDERRRSVSRAEC